MENLRSAAHRAALKRAWRRLRSFPLVHVGLFASQTPVLAMICERDVERAEAVAALPPPLSRDTDPRAEAVQMNILRRMSAADKLALVRDANACTEQLMMAGLRMRHPEAGPAELRRRLFGLMLGEDLARKAFGPLDQSLA